MAASSALLVIGPILSIDQTKAIAPSLLTLPKVGRNPVIPLTVEGEMIEPKVSVPNAKGTNPAATAEPEPAEDPLDPVDVFQGFLVFSPNQTSPQANAPILNLPNNTAPAS